MAKKNGKFLRGVLGSLVFRVVNGKQIVTIRPPKGSIKQSEATKKASQTFGMASSFAAQILRGLKVALVEPGDTRVRNKMNSAIAVILKNCRDPETGKYHFDDQSFTPLDNFELNTRSKVQDLVIGMPSVMYKDGVLRLSLIDLKIPAMLKFPHDSFKCKITFCMLMYRLSEGLAVLNPEMQELVVTKDRKSTEAQDFIFKIPEGCFCLVTMTLQYAVAMKSGWQIINTKHFNPARICATVFAPGTYQPVPGQLWTEMVKLD